ncbi:hypothetical protein AWB80_04107 [Caballeronia pedi]|uniref:Uncharacterized protein n=1 Tax=Caballeronia pedi TaxID=1777141 RepID=A0A158BTS1_9BURK|nr:hypothetical protein AWB80_04107 [Caballeronia pedi]
METYLFRSFRSADASYEFAILNSHAYENRRCASKDQSNLFPTPTVTAAALPRRSCTPVTTPTPIVTITARCGFVRTARRGRAYFRAARAMYRSAVSPTRACANLRPSYTQRLSHGCREGPARRLQRVRGARQTDVMARQRGGCGSGEVLNPYTRRRSMRARDRRSREVPAHPHRQTFRTGVGRSLT